MIKGLGAGGSRSGGWGQEGSRPGGRGSIIEGYIDIRGERGGGTATDCIMTVYESNNAEAILYNWKNNKILTKLKNKDLSFY